MLNRMPFTGRLGLLAVALTLAACGTQSAPSASSAVPLPSQPVLGAFPSDQVDGLRTEVDVRYTDVVECGAKPCFPQADVLAPADGSDLPTIVLLNGGGKLFTERRYQAPLAVELANRGAVVFLVAYRGFSTDSYVEQDSWSDARCAIRYARAHTQEYGGDPNRIVVVGHSQGGVMGLDIAIHPEEEAEGCLADGSAIPDAAIGLGSPRPTLYGSAESGPPLWLYWGSEDTVGGDWAEGLRERGFDAQAQELEGIDHDGITDPAVAPQIVDLIWEAVSSI